MTSSNRNSVVLVCTVVSVTERVLAVGITAVFWKADVEKAH